MTDMLIAVGHLLLPLAHGVAIGLVIMLPCLQLVWWTRRRDARRDLVHEQLREMEEQIRWETLPDWQREVILETRQRQQAIAREARRRLGLPEEEG